MGTHMDTGMDMDMDMEQDKARWKDLIAIKAIKIVVGQ